MCDDYSNWLVSPWLVRRIKVRLGTRLAVRLRVRIEVIMKVRNTYMSLRLGA